MIYTGSERSSNMTLEEFLSSPLMPRRETRPDMWSNENYWALPRAVHVYSHGFNNTTYDKQSKPIIQHLEDMNPEKYDLYSKLKDYEVARVVVSGEDAVWIHINISDEELRKLGVRV